MKKAMITTILLMACHVISYAQNPIEIYVYSGELEGKRVEFNFYLPVNWYNFDRGDYSVVGENTTTDFEGEEPVTAEAQIQKLFIKEGEKVVGYFIFDSSDYYLATILGQPIIKGKKYNTEGQIVSDFPLKFVKVK